MKDSSDKSTIDFIEYQEAQEELLDLVRGLTL